MGWACSANKGENDRVKVISRKTGGYKTKTLMGG